MSLNFPANPTNGDTYTSGSITYTYQDPPGKWTASTQVNLDSRYVNVSGDTMTGDLSAPKGTFSTGVLFGTDTADANTLDDYEEGTWDPKFFNNANSSTTSVYSAVYTKVGNQVTVYAYIKLTSKGMVTTEPLEIHGLPYVSEAGYRYFSCTVGYWADWNTSMSYISGTVQDNTDYILLRGITTQAIGTTNFTGAHVKTNSQILFTCTYFTP